MPLGGAALSAFIGGGLGLFGASKSADAAKSAAETQAQSGQQAAGLINQLGNRALNFQQQQWGQAQENMRPFLGYGRGAAEMLGTAMGVTPDYPQQMGGAPSSMGALYGGGPASGQVNQPTGPGDEGKRGAMPRGGQSGLALPRYGGQPAGGQMGQPPLSPQGNATANTSSYSGQKVHIKWPSGQEQDVPAYQADQYKALGAEVTT